MAGVTDRETIAFSEIDSERFGVRIARARVVSDNLSRALDFCATERIDLLVARCRTSDLEAAQGMESKGFLLMDTLLYYSFDLTKKEIPVDPCEVRVRRLLPGDEAEIPRGAAAGFQSHNGHYHSHPRLESGPCGQAYPSWAEPSFNT